MEIPKRIAKKLFEYQNRYFNKPSEVEKELSDKLKNEVAEYIEHVKKHDLKDKPETTKKQIIERLLQEVEKDIRNTSKYVQWMEQISKSELKNINEELENYIKNRIERGEKIEDTVMSNLKRRARHYEFLNYLSMHDDEAFSILKDELLKLKEQDQVPEILQTKTDKLKTSLFSYGFFELPMVKKLSETNRDKLVELLSSNQMPYGIAMFDELGFCEYLDKEKGTKFKANIIISRLYNEKAKDGTSSRHLRNSLIKPSDRYNAGNYKETVKKDYQNLK